MLIGSTAKKIPSDPNANCDSNINKVSRSVNICQIDIEKRMPMPVQGHTKTSNGSIPYPSFRNVKIPNQTFTNTSNVSSSLPSPQHTYEDSR